jgi:hypothetical protein
MNLTSGKFLIDYRISLQNYAGPSSQAYRVIFTYIAWIRCMETHPTLDWKKFKKNSWKYVRLL